jgi:CRP/FNR family transcriptional regulator, dissimilatory nitrate respiration regulator
MDYSVLTVAPLFRGLSAGEIEMILMQVPYRVKSFRAGNLIAQSGEPVKSLMIVMNGTVKGEMVDYAGRLIKIEDIPSSGALAPAFLFGNKNMFPVNVIAKTDTELLFVDKHDFLKLLKSNDKILVNFLDLIANRSQFLSEKIKFLNFKTIKNKLAYYILQKSGKENDEVILDMTQNDLADFFGVARPSVARALRELKDDGYLLTSGKHIKILNKKGLSELTNE